MSTGHIVGAAYKEFSLLDPVTVVAAGTVTGTALPNSFGNFRQALLLLDVTAAAAASGDTLDVYIDTSPDGGVTWVNVVHFTQILGNGGAKKYWAVLDPGGAPGTAVIAVTSDAASGV